jgi:alpha-amylase/alpha-mannosidase (GH57 family)
MTRERYVCIHGHFYQPPRENPWLEAIEVQDSAYPYHDWNERISAECYAPNAVSRILNGDARIERIVNNYSKISFNFGPTLLAWLEQKAPETYRAILAADRESQENFGGHGSALAQAYNHVILPLASRRDKYTQVLWGIRDFESRFGRQPEGMWLSETAVDLETLEILAEQGIKFTILAPHQARRIRSIRGRAWRDVSGGRIDPSMPYRLRLGTGRAINVFFYDGPISRAVAFEGLLRRGEDLAGRMIGAFSDSRAWPQLVHIATDGETYGHHQSYGDMALAYAIHHIERNGLARLTNYGQHLERFPPICEVQILENTSWSCPHGLERWRRDCGCHSGRHSNWKQQWRAPLRTALDWLRDRAAGLYGREGARLFQDPWIARNNYIDVILNRSPATIDEFLRRHAKRDLIRDEEVRALKLLELQRHAMLMYTSCGWFFDELSDIETVQILQYAGRVVQLSRDLLQSDLEPEFLERLEPARSNVPQYRDGRLVYEKFVRPAMIDLQKVGAHYAVSALFENYGPETRTYCYRVRRDDFRLLSAGKTRLALGRARITSEITRESTSLTFGVVHLGQHNITGGVGQFQGDESFRELSREMVEGFERGDFSELLRVVDKNFGSGCYTLKLLFRDEQRKILNLVLESTLAEAEASCRQVYDNHVSLMRFVAGLGMPLPRGLRMTAESALNADFCRALKADTLEVQRINALLGETRRVGVLVDEATLEFTLRRKIERLATEFRAQPNELSVLKALETAVDLARSLPFEVNLWAAQNAFYQTLQSSYPEFCARVNRGEEDAREWVNRFRSLGDRLSVRVE